MSLHDWLAGEAFDPEATEMMGRIYNEAMARLGPNASALVLETIALRIIEATRRGMREPQTMLQHALRGLDPSAAGG